MVVICANGAPDMQGAVRYGSSVVVDHRVTLILRSKLASERLLHERRKTYSRPCTWMAGRIVPALLFLCRGVEATVTLTSGCRSPPADVGACPGKGTNEDASCWPRFVCEVRRGHSAPVAGSAAPRAAGARAQSSACIESPQRNHHAPSTTFASASRWKLSISAVNRRTCHASWLARA